MKCMYVGGVWMRLSMYGSAEALCGTARALHLKILVRQNSTHLSALKHQNNKTSLYKLSKNHWVNILFKFLGPPEENYNLQSLMITLYNNSESTHIYALNLLELLAFQKFQKVK